MYLLKSWGESISLFKPSNFKLLLLVTLNNLRRYYKFVLWFILLFLASDNNLWQVIAGVKIVWLDYMQIFLFLYMPFIFVLFLRPSIKKKSCEYLMDHKWHFVFWLIVPFINIIFIRYGIANIVNFLEKFFGILQIKAIFIFSFPVFVLPVKIIEAFFTLFWLDSRSNFKQIFLSLWRALKMFIFNLPVYLILFVIPYLCFLFFVLDRVNIFSIYGSIFITYFVLLSYIFYTSFLVNFYTKNIHDKFNVYFRD